MSRKQRSVVRETDEYKDPNPQIKGKGKAVTSESIEKLLEENTTPTPAKEEIAVTSDDGIDDLASVCFTTYTQRIFIHVLDSNTN